MAQVLGVSEQQVLDWETGRGRVPRRAVRRFPYLFVEVGDRLEDLSGLPRCEWIEVWKSEDRVAMSARDLDVSFGEMEEHMRGCDTCRELERYIESRAGHLPMQLMQMPRTSAAVDGAGLAKVLLLAGTTIALLVLFA